ncbi:unnamed protein product [Parnassius mnemosyne]|uniref:Uncharacterized protein n=1 Tax=Parnassius mnemosyne TaxID=213953 RepID=A0AAV1KSS4_9NEOP
MQVNLDRGRVATLECLRAAAMQGYAIILMQEPYVGVKAHLSAGSQYRIIQKVTNDRNKPVRSAIVICDPKIQFTVNPNLLSEDIVGVELKINYSNIGLISMYLHENADLEEDLQTIKNYVANMNTDDIIIGGDSNARSIWWGCNADNNRGKTIMETLAELNLDILNLGTKPTFVAHRLGKLCTSIIDVTACSSSLLHRIKDWRVDDQLCTISNHKAILFNLHTGNIKTEIITRGTKIYNTKKANWEKLKNDLKAELQKQNIVKNKIEEIKSHQELEDITNKYTQCILAACNNSIPLIKQERKTKIAPWWNNEIQEKKVIMIRKRRRIKNAHPGRRKHVVELYLEARRDYINAIENATTISWVNLCNKEEKESMWQRTYRILKICSNREEDKLLRNSSGRILSEIESAEYLANTFYPEDNPDMDNEEQAEMRNNTQNIINKINNEHIPTPNLFTQNEIEQILRNINPKKAPGADGLTSDICQAAFESNPEVLQSIYNKCLIIGHFPKLWKNATIKIIPKPNKEDYTQPKAYRPIGLLPVLGKILEKLFINRVQWQLGKENKMNHRQYGFTPQKSTEDALYDTMALIKKGLKEKSIVVLVSLDIEGAFDNAWWPAIINELHSKNVDASMLRLINSYLSEREIHLKYAGQEIKKPTNRGCIQGSTCGPMFWNTLLDPLLQTTENTQAHVQAFADDILIIASNQDGQKLEITLNHTLKIITEWGKKHKLRFAPHKTQSVLITRKQKFHRPLLKMEEVELQYLDQLKVLGLTIDQNINFKPHLDNVCRKAINIYKMVSRAARANWGLNSDILRTIYMAVVEPTILYAASCWAETTNKKYIERILNRMTQIFGIRISKGHKTNSLISSTLLSKIIPLALRAKENASIYEIKRGKPIELLPGREIETRISPYDLPHPCERIQRNFKHVNNQKDIDEIKNDWVRIFTDGSKIDGKVGAAVTVWHNGLEIKTITFRLESYCSIYQAEMMAIQRALKYIISKKYPGANIISDSRSAITTICDPVSLNPIASEIRTMIKTLEDNRKQVELYWIKAHCGIQGNERADELAKQAAIKNKQSPAYDKFPLSYAKRLIRNTTLQIWQRKYEQATTSSITKKFFPNIVKAYKILKSIKMNNLVTHLFTGHGGNKAYLYKYKLSSSPCCICDENADQTIEHIVIDCPRFGKRRFETECSMGEEIVAENLKFIIEDDYCRPIFMKFALLALKSISKENGSKIID